MTMEMWHLGFYMSRLKLLMLIVVTLPLLIGLSYYSGFEETFSFKQDLVDALVAIAVGASASLIVLALLGVVTTGMNEEEWLGKLASQTVPASLGALLARSQLGPDSAERQAPQKTYWSGLFVMGAGALFLAWNIAPTEEVMLLAYSIGPVRGLLIVVVSLAIIHSFMFAMEFSGQPDIPPQMSFGKLFLRETIVGYAIALLLSAYVLWTFGRFSGLAPAMGMLSVIVLALPAAVGTAAARLIL